MRALDRKLLRELGGLWGQALAIALVIASGVATYVMSLTTYEALRQTQQSFYQDARLAEVFAGLKRAPERLSERIAAIEGVDQVQTRVVAQVNLEIADYADPVSGLLVSVPDTGQPTLNRLYLRRGGLPEPGRDDQVVLNELFADAHGLGPGDRLSAVINGHRQQLIVVGVALSPEHVFVIQPGALFPDNRSFGVLWMARTPLATAYDMQGAFNDLSLTRFAGTETADIIERLDALLEPYGGLGAYDRELQLSHRYLESELEGLRAMAAVFPVIFLGVATFLLNVVISRLISLQREQIAALKAFGYHNHEIGLHYLKLVGLIVLVGVALGIGAGAWLGHGMSELYMTFYRFPFLEYRLRPGVAVSAALISAAAGVLGTLHAVRRAVSMPPAEAMQPEPPARYRVTLIERTGLQRLLSQPARMILRNLERRPLKAGFTVLGISMGCAILVVGLFQEDAVNYMVDVQFRFAQRDDLTVSLTGPTARPALHEIVALPGVSYAEPFRSVAVRLSHEQHEYRTGIQGLPAESRLQRLLDTELRVLRLPPSGLVLTDYLAR
ncbi:MAG: ABC transporter permease, partial [Candidatus Competibacterales bacterium]|nr:ABC transporter permease [Candidatus Competibacterales bacterium]